MDLREKFKAWYKAGRIVKIAQGDDNLIVAILGRYDSYFNVGIYKHESDSEEDFNLIELNQRLTKTQALKKYKKIYGEF